MPAPEDFSDEPRVLVVGAGGLGSPVALTLAAAVQAGQARLSLTILDDDRVELSNLHRQLLHGEADVGRPKAESAADALRRVAPLMPVRTLATRLTSDNIADLCAGQHLLIDGSDSLETKFLVNDWAVAVGVPAIIGGVVRWSGQVLTVMPGGSCYRCLFEEPPVAGSVATCQAAGVLGPACGLIGALQAEEALRILRHQAPRYAGTLLSADLLRTGPGRFRRITVPRRADCRACATTPQK